MSWDTEFRPSTDLVKVQPLTCISFATEAGASGLFHIRDPRAKAFIAHTLTHDVSVGVAIAVDMAGVCLEWPDLTPLVWQAYDENRVRCLKVEGKLLDIAEDSLNFVQGAADPKAPYGLASLAKRYAGLAMRPEKNELRLGYGPLRDVPLDQWNEDQLAYPVEDALAGLAVVRATPDAGPDKFRQARHAWWACLMTAWGVRTDPIRVAALRRSLEARWMSAKGLLAEVGLIRQQKGAWVRNVKKAQAHMEAVCARGGLSPVLTDPSKRFPRGQVSLNGVLCKELGLDLGDPVLTAYADYASINKRLTTEIPKLELGEIHAFYNSLVQSGRMACGAENEDDEGSTNLTNLPRKGGIRECYVSRPGKVFFDADCDELEARTGAQACLDLVGESALADIILSGESYHLHTTAAALDLPYATVYARYKAHTAWKNGKGGREDAEVSDVRQLAKIINYGNQGGMGIPTCYKHVQKELKKEGLWDLAKRTSVDDVARTWGAWRARYPEWPRYFRQNASRLEPYGSCQIEQLYSGRVRGISGPRAYSELQNGWFQGLGADVTKDWGWRSMREMYDPAMNSVLLGSRVCIYSHDSLTGETDPEGAHEVAMRIRELLLEVSPTWCPDVPMNTTPCLTMCFSKDAKDLYDEDGRLIPWSPAEAA